MILQHNQPLLDFTSLHAGGPAESLIKLEPGDNLLEVAKQSQKPLWVLGYGTNVLISDKGLPGTVIINQVGKIELAGEGLIKADSGANWDDLVQLAIRNRLYGLEFTSGVPGGVGAAIAGNIAAYGQKIADCFIRASVLNTQDGTISEWDKTRFEFDYRTSALQRPENRSFVILEAMFQLSAQPTKDLEYESALRVAGELGLNPDTLENRRKIIIETRRRAGSLLNDPSSPHKTAGSFFKNPLVDESQVQQIIAHDETPKSKEELLRQNVIHGGSKARVSAAHVLLAAGFKRGQAWGNVRLHPDHILKVENLGGATAKEIYDVVQHILSTVHEKLGITLEPEVRFLGDFN